MTSNFTRARFGPFEVDLHTRELWKFGTKLKLVGQPFEILAVLLGRPGELVTREELRNRLWPSDTFVDFNHGLNAAVNKLRDALSDSADAPRYVETLPRRGYRFIADTEWLDVKPVAPAASAPLDPGPLVPAELPETVTARRTLWSSYFLAAGVLLSLLLVGVFLLRTVSRYRAGSAHAFVERKTRPLTSVLGAFDPAFSPGGNSVAFARDDDRPSEAGIFVTAIGSNQLLRLTRNEGDCCPVWSPDGRWIAFSRFANKEYSIYLVATDGGREEKKNAEKTAVLESSSSRSASVERKLDTNGVVPRHGDLDWSPDGKSIAFAGGAGIYLLFPEDSSVRRLTEQPPLSEDWGPSFSPDGKKVLFVRNRQMGLSNEIWATSVRGGDANRILSERGRIAGVPQWSSDGSSVIYASNRSGHPAIFRASLEVPDSPVQIDETGTAWAPAVSRRGYRLAYERVIRSLSIWQMDLSNSGDKRPSILVSSTSDTDQGPGAQFSPDGEKLAYMSDRSGTMEIWVSDREGGNPFQLSAVGGAGTPRWSPDSQAIVFDANTPNGEKILSINLRGGAPTVLTPESFTGQCPSYSRDGKWVYFASEHSGNRQVWRIPAVGGTPIQVTQRGGHAALESPDGKIIYYAKTAMAEPEIWQIPADGGAETQVPLVRPGTWASWQVVSTGIIFVGPSLGHQAVLSFFDFAKQRTTSIAVLDRIPFWLGATADGKTVAFDRPGQEQAQAMLIENFR